jgi:hypothetical protein
VFFDCTYTAAEYLTTHRDFYLHVERVVFVFCFFSFFCLNVNSGTLAQLAVRGGGFLLSRVLLLVILLVVHVFVVGR